VLRHWPPNHDLEQAHGLPPGALAAAAFAPERLGPAVVGAVTDEQWRAAIVADLAVVLGSAERARAAVAAWSAVRGTVDPAVVELLTRARAVVPVALVSNATTRLEADLEWHGLADLADVVVNTARIGVAKPDPRVYLLAAARLGVPVHRCLFVDDTAANVAAAEEVGMTAVHYGGIDDLRRALAPVIAEHGPAASRPARRPPGGGPSRPRR
jgi:putative hydrolase of the HAD superfamily